MSRGGRVEAELEAVRRCAADPTAPASVGVLRATLEKAGSFAVAAAAKIVGEAEVEALAGELAPAFRRFVAEGVKRDPGCRAKETIVEALCRLGRDEVELFEAAMELRQLEPVWGGTADTAANLRAHAAMGLARSESRDAGIALATLLVDEEWVARAGAARALGFVPQAVAEPLLRYKTLSGDAEPQVIGECLRSILALAPGSLDFVAASLEHDRPAIREQAALALGESRLEGAFPILCEWLERATREDRRAGVLAIAMLRRDDATDWLLARIAEPHVLDALAIFKHDARVRDRVFVAVRGRKDRRALLARARELFGSEP